MPLFRIQEYAGHVLVTVDNATAEEAQALAELLSRSRKFGAFRQSVSTGTIGYSSQVLRFDPSQAAVIANFLGSLTKADLAAEVVLILEAKAQTAARQQAFAEMVSLPTVAFAELLEARSAGKLRALSMVCGTFVIKAAELMPVSHFKALARLTRYDGKAKTFNLRNCEMDGKTRQSLLDFASKLSRSTKVVTHSDISARRTKLRGKAKFKCLNIDYMEALEDHGQAQADEWLREGRLTDSPGKPDHEDKLLRCPW